MSGNLVHRIAAGAVVTAGALALTACGSNASGSTQTTTAGAPTNSSATQTSSSTPDAAVHTGSPSTKATESTPRCTTADLSLTVGTPNKHDDKSGQFDVPLTYKNKSGHTCALHGVPGVDLLGPDDPVNGPVYHLPRVDNGVKYNEVTPGTTATATITVLTPTEGAPGWTPTSLKTIPPGQATPLSAQWPSDLPVIRQDAATHPGTYVNGILADPA